MAFLTDIELRFIPYIRNWYAQFKEIVYRIQKSGRKLYVIAISRKMPRFFSWLIKNERTLGIEGLRDILESADYSTEHSLPFLFQKENPASYEVLVVDDSMVLGNTVRRVSEDVIAYTNGKKPIISILVSSETAYVSPKSIQELHTPNIVEDSLITKWLDFVSSCNAKSELPVDVEFPILHISGSKKEAYRRQIQDALPNNQWYELNKEGIETSINVLLDEEIVELTSLDFAKSRCFFYKDEVKLSVFSPFAIMQSAIFEGYIFRDKTMNEIWERINLSVTKRNEKRTYQSLVVIINYLNAINTFRRNKDLIHAHEASDCEIKVGDLQLLIGKNLANYLIGSLSSLLFEDWKQGFIVIQPELPSLYAPKELEFSYIIQRKLIASQRRADRNVELLIKNIFDQARYDKSIMGRNTTVFHRMHSAFFETYDSIKQLINFYFTVENIYLEINKSIDILIDEGKIIPQYVQVLNNQRETYWRRFFTSAHSSVEL